MLFNSYTFILGFLPIVLIGYFLIARVSHFGAGSWLALSSLVFYGWWDSRYVLLLLGSIALNFSIGRAIALAVQRDRDRRASALLTLGVTVNLAALAYFKYWDFFLTQLNHALGMSLPIAHIVLPLGISFFTFTQIAFLADVRKGCVSEHRPVDYLLFVTYFPHLIAGPVLHHKEMMPQFRNLLTYMFNWENLAVGMSIFIIGLAKKVLLADGVAQYASPVFDAAAGGHSPDFFEAWCGALAYTLQLYFDFSGYSDMAIGLSRLFGVILPLNFDSPYKSVNIIEFWRRWHMTLSRFLRDYLYIPLGGNRLGKMRRYANLMITMGLGGLWHGAGWTFIAWGLLHGMYLVVNHMWHWLCTKIPTLSGRMPGTFSIALTFIAVVIAWVVFRASSMEAALRILEGMSGQNGIPLPGKFLLPSFITIQLEYLGFHFGWPGSLFRGVKEIAWITCLLAVVWLAPNTQEIMCRFRPALESADREAPSSAWRTWTPSLRWAIALAILLIASLTQLNMVSEFLYFQF